VRRRLAGEDMKCPHCGGLIPQPTPRQQEAYRLTRIHKCTQEQAALIMGVKRSAISRLMLRLKKIRPDLFTDETCHIKRKKPFSYSDDRDSLPKMKF